MLKREVHNYILSIVTTFCCLLNFSLSAQETQGNSVKISTEEGWYTISIPNKDLVETIFKAKDSVDSAKAASDSLFVELGSASENITLSTAATSDTLKIDMESLELIIIKEPFSINYHFLEPWYNVSNGKKFDSRSTYSVSDQEKVISSLASGGSLVSSVKPEREELWQVHYFFDAGVKEKEQTFCPEDFNAAPAGNDCFNVSYNISGKELNIEVNAASNYPALDEVEFIIEGLENRIQFVWLNNIKYTHKNFLHEGKQIIPLRFDNLKNHLRIELK